MKNGLIAAGVIALVVIGIPALMVGSAVLGWFGRAADVAMQEVDPKTLLTKYEWFKSARAELDKKRADIKVYDNRLSRITKDYGNKPRSQWARVDKEQVNQWETESAGIRASFNSLAAEYNAQMAKINWRFCNAGMLPQGATEVLPREFTSYLEE